MSETSDKTSEPIALLQLVWRNANSATDHSWERLNHAMSAALLLAIGSGFVFWIKDVDTVRNTFRSGYWCQWESMYSLAILVGNKSFIDDFESSFNRPGFIADNVRDRANGYGFAHVSSGALRKRERLTLGAEFPWRGETVRVTSFAEDGGSLVACSYRRDGEAKSCKTCNHQTSWPREKLSKRYAITRQDIADDRARRALASRLKTVPDGSRAAVFAALNLRGTPERVQSAWDKLPVSEIRSVVDQWAPKVKAEEVKE